MKKLDRSAFDRTAAFIAKHARPLERKICDFHFSGGSSQAIVDELLKCQNDDGGFANSQEPVLVMGRSLSRRLGNGRTGMEWKGILAVKMLVTLKS